MNAKVRISTIECVKEFVKRCSTFDCDIFLTDGRDKVDAKSIMGIFSLNLRNPVNVYTTDKKYDREVEEALRSFIVEG